MGRSITRKIDRYPPISSDRSTRFERAFAVGEARGGPRDSHLRTRHTGPTLLSAH